MVADDGDGDGLWGFSGSGRLQGTIFPAQESICHALRGVLGRLGSVLGRLGGVLGASWDVLGRFGGVFGASWGVLGRLGGILCLTCMPKGG